MKSENIDSPSFGPATGKDLPPARAKTDRELLELAAKAVGLPAPALTPTSPGLVGWNPLTDDGDALRLAVQLQMDVMTPAPTSDKRGPCASTVYPTQRDFDAHSEWLSDHAGDPNAATRYAIVRSAAQIGADSRS